VIEPLFIALVITELVSKFAAPTPLPIIFAELIFPFWRVYKSSTTLLTELASATVPSASE